MPSDRVREILLESIAPRLEEVVANAAGRARREIPAYAEIPEQEIADGIARDLGVGLAALVDDRPLAAGDRDQLGIIGDTRARQGLPLESMLRVYRFTIEELFDVLWQASEQGILTQDEVLGLMREVFRYSDAVTEVAVASYRERELELAISGTEERTALVHRLLLTSATTPPEAITRVGLDPDAPYRPFRARAGGEAETRDLLRVLQSPGLLPGGLVAAHDGDVVGLAPERPRHVPDDGTVIGLGPSVPVATLSRSFAVASRVVEVAVAFGRTGLLELADLALEAVVRSEGELTADLVARLVDPAEPDTPAGRELLETVEGLLDCDGSVEAAAARLHVHPNTVRNRQRRYEQLTGVSLRAIDDLLRVRLALLRASLR